METEKFVNRQWRGEKQRNMKQWLRILELRSKDLTFAQVATLTGISRQRAHQIVAQAKSYAARKDDALARKITELLTEGK